MQLGVRLQLICLLIDHQINYHKITHKDSEKRRAVSRVFLSCPSPGGGSIVPAVHSKIRVVAETDRSFLFCLRVQVPHHDVVI